MISANVLSDSSFSLSLVFSRLIVFSNSELSVVISLPLLLFFTSFSILTTLFSNSEILAPNLITNSDNSNIKA
jgi:hypothetical protein